MKSYSERTNKTVDNILQVTKKTIQQNDNYYDYYINKDNSLYMKQLPLLIQKSKLQAIAIRKRENEKNHIEAELEEPQNRSVSIDKYMIPLIDIRNAQSRSKKLPPLCPFYNNRGELLRSVVTTSKLINNNYLNDDSMISARPKIKIIKIKNSAAVENTPGLHPVDINFDDFQNDFFYEQEYSTYVFKDSEIFGKKEHYFEFIKNKINDFRTNEIEDKEFKKEKIFDKNKQKKNISLIFESLSVKIYEMKKEENENGTTNKDVQIFEYNLPFAFLPLFYYKGEEKFKIILSKIIQYDSDTNNFKLNENPESYFKDILNNCVDFKEEKKEEPKKEVTYTEETMRPSKQKFSLTMGGKKNLKKEMAGFKFNPLGSTIIEEQNMAQTMAGNIPNTYLTNLDDSKKRYDIVSQSSIYPTKKEHNYINFNIFEFLWMTPNQSYKVCITTPIVTINIPKNNIKVKKYVDFELLLYLYENEFKNWDFYLVKYLSSYKSFRALLEEINSINESYNKDFYLTKPRIKSYLFNNTKIVNIATIKKKDVLENLIEGLMGIPEEKKEEEHKDDKNNSKNDEDNKSEKKNEENDKGEEKKEKEEKEEISKRDLVNSTFVQKCFLAVIRFVDTKTFKAHEYKIYFNFNQFKKFQKMEKYIDKISFLVKFIDINYVKKSVNIDYKSLDNFNETEWIKDYKQYNSQYLQTLDNRSNNSIDYHRTSAEYLGMTKNSVIQIEVYTPISLARILNESGSIKTEKILLNNNYQDKAVNIEKDDILEMSKIFYHSYEEEQNAKK